jgi:hypothetical protein
MTGFCQFGKMLSTIRSDDNLPGHLAAGDPFQRDRGLVERRLDIGILI